MPSIWDERLPNGLPAMNVGWRGWEDEDAGGPPIDATPEERESTRLMNQRAEQMKNRPSIDDEEFQPGVGRRLAAAVAAGLKGYVDMGRRTHVPDEPAAQLQEKLLHPGYAEATRRWENEGTALDTQIQAAQAEEKAAAEARDAELRGRRTGAEIDAARARQKAEEARQASYQREQVQKPYVVSEGQAVVGPDGKVVYERPKTEQPLRRTGDPVANALIYEDDPAIRERAQKVFNAQNASRGRQQPQGPKPQDYVRLEQWKVEQLNAAEAAAKKEIDDLRKAYGEEDPTLSTPEAQAKVKEIQARLEESKKALQTSYDQQQQIFRHGPGAYDWQNPYR